MAGNVRWSSFAKAWPIANNLLLLLLSAHPLFVDCFASLLMASHWRPILGLSPLSKTSFSYSLSLSFCHYCHICSLIWVTLTDFTIRWCPVLRLTFHHVAVYNKISCASCIHHATPPVLQTLQCRPLALSKCQGYQNSYVCIIQLLLLHKVGHIIPCTHIGRYWRRQNFEENRKMSWTRICIKHVKNIVHTNYNKKEQVIITEWI